MPRRPSTKNRSKSTKPRPVDRASARINKWNRASDIPLDEEDLFHNSRDKVLLESEADFQQDDDGDDEVFALKGLNDDSEYEDENDIMEEDDEGADDEPAQSPVKVKKAGKVKKKRKDTESDVSDESEEVEETWGRKKSSWYDSNAVQLESDDEEGNELEEQEAKRLQTKAREEMTNADFGLDDIPDEQGLQETHEPIEPAPMVIESLPQDKKLLLRHLEKISPETLALARDWEDTVENLSKTQEKLKLLESENPRAPSLGMIHIYYQAILTYSTTLAFYIHLRCSEKYARRPELLRTHPVLQRLLKLKQSLLVLEDLNFDASDDDDDDDESDDDEDMTWDDIMTDGESLWNPANAIDKDELRLLIEEAASRKRKPEHREPPRKKLKTSQTSKPVEPPSIFDLVEPEYEPSKSSSLRVSSENDITDVYGEASTLQHADAADKIARKKSLRFHTSKIESSSARRRGARSQAIGGDDDIPYRERRRERETRLAKVDVKSRGQGGEDLDETEPAPRPPEQMEDKDDISQGPDGYYELIKKRSQEKKIQKKAEYDAMRDAARPDFDEGPVAGPRSLTRAILANKGLTPHRPKSVRNPRVKKRLKFDKAKKKLSSQKALYKGGLADTGRYDGERSGISKVIKSIRLG